MKKLNSYFGEIAILSGAILISVNAWGFGGEKQNVREEVTVTPLTHTTSAQAEFISSMAVKALSHITEARSSLSKKLYSKTRDHLGMADTLFRMIQEELPTMKIEDRITIARNRLEYKDTEQVQADLVPIESELDFLPDAAVTEQGKVHLDKAREYLKNGQKQAAKDELKKVDDLIVYSQVNLPVRETESHVKAAQAALAKKDYAAADSALEKAEHNFNVEIVALDESLPQMKAKANKHAQEPKKDKAKGRSE